MKKRWAHRCIAGMMVFKPLVEQSELAESSR
jgi:hypothetical protein